MAGQSGVFFENKVIVFGGCAEDFYFSNDLYIYDI